MTGPLAFTNPNVQRLRRLLGRRSARSEEGCFVVEGPLLLAEAEAAGWEIESVFLGEGAASLGWGEREHRLAAGVLERVAATESPQGVLAIVRDRPVDATIVAQAGFVLAADRLADPGNLGTIIRSAMAAGADLVTLGPGSVDVHNPKAVRASAGAIFRVPVATGIDLAALRRPGRTVLGTSSHRGAPYDEVDLTGDVVLVVGSESHGLPDDAAVDAWVTIPHAGPAESLNVAMAATVLCFEAARQRRRGSGSVAPR